VGRLTLALLTASATWLMPMPREASSLGSSWMRTAYFCAPNTCTWATPLTMEMRWPAGSRRIRSGCRGAGSAMSGRCAGIGWSAGVDLAEIRAGGHVLGQVARHPRNRHLPRPGGGVDVAVDIELQDDSGCSPGCSPTSWMPARGWWKTRASQRRGHGPWPWWSGWRPAAGRLPGSWDSPHWQIAHRKLGVGMMPNMRMDSITRVVMTGRRMKSSEIFIRKKWC